MLRFLIAFAMAAWLATSTLMAAPITVNQANGTTNVAGALTTSTTTGADMVGMQVTAFFLGGGSATLNWASLGGSNGGVSGSGFSLTETGNTFGGTWTLTNTGSTAITRVLIDGAPGKTVFDRTFGGNSGTPNSAAGLDFNEISSTSFPITATYRDLVAIGANPPVGDIFRFLDIQFTGAGGFTAGSTLLFQADADNATTEIAPVPEPASLALFGLASIVGAGYWLRNRRSPAKV